jgi:hypothetical protein
MNPISNPERDLKFLNQVSRILGEEQDYSSSVSVQGGDESARLWVEEESSETRYGIVALGVESEDSDYVEDVFETLDGAEIDDKGITMAVEGTVDSYNELDEIFRAYQEVKSI